MNNKITWALQTNLVDTPQTQSLFDALQKSGTAFCEAIVLPFMSDFDNASDLKKLSSLVVPYGSTKMVKLAQQYFWEGLFFNDNFQTVVWNNNHPQMLNKEAIVISLKQAQEWAQRQPPDNQIFIRPVLDLKEFQGTVTTIEDLRSWPHTKTSGNFDIDLNTQVSIAPLQELLSEARFFVVNKTVVSGSFYRQGGKLRSEEILSNQKLFDQAQELADVWLPHDHCVMDLAQTPEGVKVIEFNTLNCAGFYHCDIEKIVSSVNEALTSINPTPYSVTSKPKN